MFGSARTLPDDPVYLLARDLAATLAAGRLDGGHRRRSRASWRPGSKGAGREHAFGVNIRLPLEEGANPFIAQDPKLVEMRYFFTRKLMLIKESHAYAILPGRLRHPGRGLRAPHAAADRARPSRRPSSCSRLPGGTYWHGWLRFVDRSEAIAAGWVSPDDRALFKVTDVVEEATEELLGFYRNYHSCRWVGDLLVLRLQTAPEQGRAGRPQPALRRHRRPGPACACPSRSPPSGPTTTTPTCPDWPSASTSSTTAGCAS